MPLTWAFVILMLVMSIFIISRWMLFFPHAIFFDTIVFSSQVTSAFGILILVMSIYAVMAVDLFSVQDSEYFGNLSRALFTIFQVTFFFQVTTGDGWSSVAKQHIDAIVLIVFFR